MKWFKMGEEAVLDLPTWSLSGGAVAKVRQFINKVRREAPDLGVREYRRRAPNPDVDEQLEDISSEWLATKKGGEMGFNLGVFSVEDLADKRTFVAARADGTIEAFVTWLPYPGRARRRARRDAPPPVGAAGRHGHAHRRIRAGLQAGGTAAVEPCRCPAGQRRRHGVPFRGYDRAVRLIFDHFSQVYGYRTLFQYKKKFGPRWEPRYLVFPRPDLLPRVAYAVVQRALRASLSRPGRPRPPSVQSAMPPRDLTHLVSRPIFDP